MSDIEVRFADGDNDVIAIHGFLCVVAGPLLPGEIDPQKSAAEVWRVVTQECAMMAMWEDRLVGTIGLIRCDFWWGNQAFLANRWFFSLPDVPAGLPLLQEAKRFAKSIGLECQIYDEQKGRLVILNKDKRRRSVNPIFEKPELVH